MANTLLTPLWVTYEGLRVLMNNLVIGRLCDRQYSDQFAVAGAKKGQTIQIRKPTRYITTKGSALVIQDVTETYVPLTLDQQANIGIAFGSAELALSADDYSDRYLSPAIASIANTMDTDVGGLYNNLFNTVGTPGVTPTAFLTYGLAKVALDNQAAPDDMKRVMVLSSLMDVTITDSLKGLFHAGKAIAEQYRKGSMGGEMVLSFDWYMSQNVPTHTVGALGGTPLIDGAGQTGSTLLLKGWTAAAATRLLKGDTFTVAGINGVNPQSRKAYGLQKFVVTADTASDGSGGMTVPIYPPIVIAGAFQTVDATAADGAAITVDGAANTVSPQGLAYHPECFTIGTADLFLPAGADVAERVNSKQLGVSLRLVKDYLIGTDQEPARVDVLYGVACLRPEIGARVEG